MTDILPLRSGALAPLTPKRRRRKLPRLVADAKGLAKMLGLGLRTIRTHDAAGKLPAPVRIGGRVVWSIDEIRAWLRAGAPDRETWAAIRDARTH